MAWRCIHPFVYGNTPYPGGVLVDDDDPILATHRDCFERVGQPVPVTRTETTAARTRRRGRPRKHA